MKLLDLEPTWLERDDRKVGFAFRCPLDHTWWQTVYFEPTPMREQFKMTKAALGDKKHGGRFQPADQSFGWSLQSEPDFAVLTISPSVDGSRGGLWHGFIQNGQIVGGVP